MGHIYYICIALFNENYKELLIKIFEVKNKKYLKGESFI